MKSCCSQIQFRQRISLILGFGVFWIALQLSPGVAWSQQTGDNNSRAFQVQQFRPWADPQGMLQTQSATGLAQWNYFVALYLNYSKDPLTLRQEGNRFAEVLKHQLGADLVAGIGFLSWFNLMVSIPMTLYQDGAIPAGLEPGRDNNLSGFAFSDVKVALKFQLLREDKHFISLGLLPYVGFPTSDKNRFNGEDSVSFGVSLLLSRRISIVHLALNLGYRYLPPSQLLNLEIQHEFTYSLAASVQVMPKHLDLLVDFTGSSTLPASSLESLPMEVMFAGRVFPMMYKDLALTLGVGVGILPGYGTPQFRVLFGLSWSPTTHDFDKDGVADHLDRCPRRAGPKENQGCPWPDTDGDGLTDNLDKCPKRAGPKANQGCPWPDTDGDSLTDNIDKCPKKPGPTANKGCPWPDTDKDGLTDNIDKCPKKAGPGANNGCPWPDTDGDGLTDNIDNCPKKPGPKENKGCPDTDQDKDGVVDRLDKCPFVPGLKSRKGCPKVILVQVTAKRIKILQKIFFAFNSARIRRRSYPILDQVFAVMKSRSKISVRIEGHTDNVGRQRYNQRLSERRALSVKRYLMRKGVDKNRLLYVGYGMTRPLASNTTKKGRAQNRRVEFHILPHSK